MVSEESHAAVLARKRAEVRKEHDSAEAQRRRALRGRMDEQWEKAARLRLFVDGAFVNLQMARRLAGFRLTDGALRSVPTRTRQCRQTERRTETMYRFAELVGLFNSGELGTAPMGRVAVYRLESRDAVERLSRDEQVRLGFCDPDRDFPKGFRSPEGTSIRLMADRLQRLRTRLSRRRPNWLAGADRVAPWAWAMVDRHLDGDVVQDLDAVFPIEVGFDWARGRVLYIRPVGGDGETKAGEAIGAPEAEASPAGESEDAPDGNGEGGAAEEAAAPEAEAPERAAQDGE